MVAGLFGVTSSYNHICVLNLSGLMHFLEEILFPDFVLAGGILPALYGDSIL
jgi:hypothetical protein